MVKTFRNLTITKFGKGKLPRLPFLVMKEEILGKNYELSVVFTTSKESKKINLIYRNKNKPANILSFPLSKKHGEIHMDEKEINKSAKVFERTGDKLMAFFYIHGLVHLKGMKHGSTMEKTETQFYKKFKI